MKIISLSENTSCNEIIKSEHGLSLYIETKNKKLLFDMGQGELFSRNAALLGVNLKNVDIAVISHGHYDHGGGLKTFLSINPTAPIYISKHAFEPHYNSSGKYIGIDETLKCEPRLHFTEGKTNIEKGLTLFDCNGYKKAQKTNCYGLTMLENGINKPDDFRHEHYLLIEENGKKVLISGCSHKGIINILEWFKPDILIGGFHLKDIKAEKELTALAKQLSSYKTEFFTCHCTGIEQFKKLNSQANQFKYLSAGDIIEI